MVRALQKLDSYQGVFSIAGGGEGMSKEIEVLNIRNLPCVKRLIKEIEFLEYYLLESPWKYEGEGKSIKPTFVQIKNALNETLRLLLIKKRCENND